MPHIKLEFHHSRVTLTYFTAKNVIFLHLWPQKLYRAFRFGTLWPISCSYPRHSQLTRHSLMLANGRIRQSLTALVQLTSDFTCVLIGWVFMNYLMLGPMAKNVATGGLKMDQMYRFWALNWINKARFWGWYLFEGSQQGLCHRWYLVYYGIMTPYGALLLHGLTLIPAWISNCIHYKLWDEITYPFLNFKGATV